MTAQEGEVQRQVKQAGGTWDATHRVWKGSDENVRELGVEDRIVVSDNGRGHEHGESL